ncbi:DUF3945 domain-containing protein [Flavobacterium sp. 7A]|uniref:DUF3945 domain-containing protein n=1 Tax=Flavobacterium sp. 7A TaxID=2940571 RepID=UPI002226FCF5|nr:DUF3945 domain-containing protein [Flavobacterium sp. 7A]MCW2120672.1 hypothetical protein [Flavobacterium sp. 7A]
MLIDKNKKKIEASKENGKNKDLQTLISNKKNENQFMRVDKQGDLFSNFFSNFYSQLKDPTHFHFFKGMIEKVKTITDYKQENNTIMETKQSTPETSDYRYKVEQIDWKAMTNLGLSKERLEKMNLLDPLLKGFKTNELVPVTLDLGTSVTRMDARLSLQAKEDGQVVLAIHGIRKEPQLQFKFFGHEFTKEDKDNLLKNGNMGRVVELINPKTGEKIPSIISIDKLTNELIALRTTLIKIPNEIKGVKLDDQQKNILSEGKPLHLEGMISKKGEPFNASVQFNADKRYVEFLFDRGSTNKQTENQNIEAPKNFRGKELDAAQFEKFKEGQTVYVSGLLDKKGKEYQGYITFDKDSGKTGFSFDNPNKIKEKAQPKEENKTQVAVNSEGKTNEATKNSKEPLKSKQNNPDDSKQQEEQEKPKAAAKSKGRKM